MSFIFNFEKNNIFIFLLFYYLYSNKRIYKIHILSFMKLALILLLNMFINDYDGLIS